MYNFYRWYLQNKQNVINLWLGVSLGILLMVYDKRRVVVLQVLACLSDFDYKLILLLCLELDNISILDF